MKSDGPILMAVLSLAAGLAVIFTYGTGTTNFNAAYPLAGANLQLSIATAGPAAVGGLALVALGLLIMAWALICAVVGLFTPAGSYRDNPARAERLEQKRLDREERIAQKRREKEEKEMGREGRLFPRE